MDRLQRLPAEHHELHPQGCLRPEGDPREIERRLDEIEKKLDRIIGRQENPPVSYEIVTDLGFTQCGSGVRFREHRPVRLPPAPRKRGESWLTRLGRRIADHPVCFARGTEVHTPAGVVPIEGIAVDSCVLTRANDGALLEANVARGMASNARVFISISLQGETIRCTPQHPFWVVDRGWVRAGHLEAGDRLLDIHSEAVIIESVVSERTHASEPVYDLSVEEVHTYYVGQAAVLVHNKWIE